MFKPGRRLVKQLVPLVVALLLADLFANATYAGIISRDLHEPGDGLLTYDTQSGREWLDILLLYGLPVNELPTVLSPGGTYSGFKLASFADVEQFAFSAGFDHVSPALLLGDDQDFDVAYKFIDHLSGYYASGSILNESWGTYAILSDNLSEQNYEYIRSLAIGPEGLVPGALNPLLYARKGSGFLAHGHATFSAYPSNPTLGYWLYRETVAPEPSTILMASIAALICRTRRIRKVNLRSSGR